MAVKDQPADSKSLACSCCRVKMDAVTLAHSVRNPLNAIKGAMACLGGKYSSEPSFREFSDIIAEEIMRLDGFISGFLRASMLEEGYSWTDLNFLVQKVGIFISLQAEASGIKPRFVYGDIPQVSVNAYQLEQAILNVINNSIESMPAGGSLNIRTFLKKGTDTDFVVIRTSDTGKAMPEKNTGGISGRGFGLRIASQVLQSHGGRIEIKNGRGKGTVVSFYIPVNEERGEDERRP